MKLSHKKILILLLFIAILILMILLNKNYEKFENREKESNLNIAIHSVFILPENYIFLEEWIAYHIELGFTQFYLYDNYGSVSRGKGRTGNNESSLNKTRAGIEFLKLFNFDIYDEFEKLKKKYPGIHHIKWQPKDEDGNISYFPGKAIAHYRDNYAKNSDWTAFIDPDEFIVFKNTNNNNLKKFIQEKESNKITKLFMKQKKMRDRFCSIDKYIFDITDTIININVDGWAYKCLYKNSALSKSETDFFMHSIKTDYGDSHTCELTELRFNHYNINNTQIGWMKGFFKTDKFDNGKDETMKKFKYIIKKYNIPKHKYNRKYFLSLKDNLCYNFNGNIEAFTNVKSNTKTKIYFPKFTDLNDYPCQMPDIYKKHKFVYRGKLAFLFLLKNELQFKEIWKKFFSNIDEKYYIILVHFSDYNINIKLPFNYIQVQTVKTEWSNLYKAHIALFTELKKHKNVYGSVFVSNNCIPVKTFSQCYSKLSNSTTSILNFNRADCSWMSHWSFLKYNDIMLLLKHSHKYEDIWKKLNKEKNTNNGPEEIYPPYILNKYSKSLTHGVITFDCWGPEKMHDYIENESNNKYVKTSPTHFSTIDKKLLDNLVKRDVLFARKFDINTVVKSSNNNQLLTNYLINIY